MLWTYTKKVIHFKSKSLCSRETEKNSPRFTECRNTLNSLDKHNWCVWNIANNSNYQILLVPWKQPACHFLFWLPRSDVCKKFHPLDLQCDIRTSSFWKCIYRGAELIHIRRQIVFQETTKTKKCQRRFVSRFVCFGDGSPLRFSDIQKCLQFNYCLCCARLPSGASSCEAAQDEKHTREKKEKEEINGEKAKDECVLTVGMSLDPQVMSPESDPDALGIDLRPRSSSYIYI